MCKLSFFFPVHHSVTPHHQFVVTQRMVQSDPSGNKYQFLPFDQIQNSNLLGFFKNLLLEFIL